MSELIRNYIAKDIVSYAHIEDLLNRNHTIIFESSKGFIIKDEDCSFIYMSFSDLDVMKQELSKKRYEHYITYTKEVVDFYGDNDKVKKLYQYIYPSTDLFDVDQYDVRVLSVDYASYIDSFYKAIAPGETSAHALERGDVIGIFEDNKLAGIIGRHPEGCMGMLKVLGEYRGKKYGEVLEKAMINKLIKEKQKVFCEVVDGNDVSFHLQNKLGLIKGELPFYWLV